MPSLRAAIDWIAQNDEANEEDPARMEDLISVQLVADLFSKDPADIASRVIKLRREVGILGPAPRKRNAA